MGVSLAALYEKLNHLEPNVSSALIRQTAADAAKVMDAMPAGRRHVLPGREIYYLDGNHLAGSEHRQKVELTDGPHRWRLRRITVQLDRPTANGDPEIHLLSDLPARSVSALRIASAYRGRRTIEGAFQTLTDVLRCEVETLGYPQAALFAFATAVPAYNTYAVVNPDISR